MILTAEQVRAIDAHRDVTPLGGWKGRVSRHQADRLIETCLELHEKLDEASFILEALRRCWKRLGAS